jgi:hypothetical protein
MLSLFFMPTRCCVAQLQEQGHAADGTGSDLAVANALKDRLRADAFLTATETLLGRDIAALAPERRGWLQPGFAVAFGELPDVLDDRATLVASEPFGNAEREVEAGEHGTLGGRDVVDRVLPRPRGSILDDLALRDGGDPNALGLRLRTRPVDCDNRRVTHGGEGTFFAWPAMWCSKRAAS